MSDSQRALDITHAALLAMHENGAKHHASADVLAALAATTTSVSKTQSASALPRLVQRPATALPAAAPAFAKPEAPAPAETAPTPRLHVPALTSLPSTSALAPANGTKAERLEAMRGPVLACELCPNLVKFRTQVVFGVGNPNADLMFVGEAPGADEDLVGEPFVGKAGQLLTKIIETMGFQRSEVYIANVLKCRPDMPPGVPGNRKPTGPEMQTCKPYLLEQIQIIQPRVLVALGATGLEGLLGVEKVGITRERGHWREFQGIPLMPTFHPSYLLRNQALSTKREVWEDMLAVLTKLGRPISPKQQAYFLPKA